MIAIQGALGYNVTIRGIMGNRRYRPVKPAEWKDKMKEIRKR